MKMNKTSLITQLMLGSSVMVMAAMTPIAGAQVADDEVEEIVVTGIRQSLKASMDVKRNATGVVDAITAEDIGKFPDTNLAESLQRIPGVSIDRSNGEGSTVTVRGWGADYNLVTFNGRVMPTSSTGDLNTRSFDFGNLASEAISSVEVYKTSKVNVASGGAGATINIKTTKPLEASGRVASFGIKGVYDTSAIEDEEITPEVSGIYVNQFLDNRLGVSVSASYQKREGGVTQYNSEFRDALRGDENGWGQLPSADAWNFAADQGSNRPGPSDVYAVPQNGDYSLTDFSRERLNGQLVMQYDITENLRATGDFTYSSNEVESNKSSAGVWFNHDSTVSAWTDGPVASPLYYKEFLGNSDLSYSGSLAASKNENISTGLNLAWQATDRLSLELDVNDASAESGPNNNYGTAMSIGTAAFTIADQTINFENDLPIISYTSNMPDLGDFDASVRESTGSAFTNNFMRSEVQQVQLNGSYEVDRDIIDSVDFGVSLVNNNVRTEAGNLQSDTWGQGALGGPDDIPDEIFEWVTLPDKFDGVSGSNDPNMLQGLYRFNFTQMADLLEDKFQICSNPRNVGTNIPGTCLAVRDQFKDLEESTISAYAQFNTSFIWNDYDVNLTAGGRYIKTDVTSEATVRVPQGTSWSGGNEFNLAFDGTTESSSFEGDYAFFLPSVDADIAITDNIKLRGAFSKTIGRHRYNEIQGGLSLNGLFREREGTGNAGNPSLEPFTSTNFDVSAEWYYGDDSYVSVGYFRKDIENFVGQGQRIDNFFDLRHPGLGSVADRARAAVPGGDAVDILAWYVANEPQLVNYGPDGTTPVSVNGSSSDPLLDFRITEPVVSDRTDGFTGWEFALQHTFGETGFGVIANYTIAETELEYDNTKSASEFQLAVTGVSDSANLVGFYDKNGLQARIAYNWRDKFLSGGGFNPFYTEAYDQIDANISYDINDNLTVFAEGIDITGTDRRGHKRSENAAYFVNPQDGRYAMGARYKF